MIADTTFESCDVAVLGGGPAGAACAIALARAGVGRVVLCESEEVRPFRLGETIPPDSRSLLDRLGVLDAFLADDHMACHGSCSSWGSDGLGYNDFMLRPYGHGWHIDRPRFGSRQALLRQFDQLRRTVNTSVTKSVNEVDENYAKAFDVLTSSQLVDALDVTKEDPAVRERYGKGSSKHLGDGAPMWNDQLLIARRLVEAGVRVVTVAYGFWDTHGNNFGHMKSHLPLWDTGISALIEDIHKRGLDQDVTVCVWDEFGRTPKINKNAGRDHWAPVNYALLSGGGMNMGQMIGTTEKTGGYAATRPVHYRDILSTLYHNLGIDSHDLVRDQGERPMPILPSHAAPIRELVG